VIESAVDSGSSFIVTFPCSIVGSSSSGTYSRITVNSNNANNTAGNSSTTANDTTSGSRSRSRSPRGAKIAAITTPTTTVDSSNSNTSATTSNTMANRNNSSSNFNTVLSSSGSSTHSEYLRDISSVSCAHARDIRDGFGATVVPLGLTSSTSSSQLHAYMESSAHRRQLLQQQQQQSALPAVNLKVMNHSLTT
jgi:hypothetical protein